MDYQGYKLIDKIILVCKEKRSNEPEKDYLQAYLVDPSNKKQLESARNWASYIEFGKYNHETHTYEYKIEHKPIEYEFENKGFNFELLDCAGGSSQGGKLSFWNCIVEKDELRFMIGINSTMLLQVLKEGRFTYGICDNKVCFASQKGNCGVVIEDGETYKLAKKDMELKTNVSKSLTTKYKPGDNVITTTLNEMYLGKVYRYYTWEDNYDYWRRSSFNRSDYRDCTLIKHKEPIPIYIFCNRDVRDKDRNKLNKLSEIMSDDIICFYPNLVNKLPKRAIGLDPLEMDIEWEEFSHYLFDKHNQFNSELEATKYRYAYTDINLAVNFADNRFFGVSLEPFELSDEMMNLFKEHKIKIIEE